MQEFADWHRVSLVGYKPVSTTQKPTEAFQNCATRRTDFGMWYRCLLTSQRQVDDTSKSPSKSPPKAPKQRQPLKSEAQAFAMPISEHACPGRLERRGTPPRCVAARLLDVPHALALGSRPQIISLDKRCYSCCSQSQMVMAGFKPGAPMCLKNGASINVCHGPGWHVCSTSPRPLPAVEEISPRFFCAHEQKTLPCPSARFSGARVQRGLLERVELFDRMAAEPQSEASSAAASARVRFSCCFLVRFWARKEQLLEAARERVRYNRDEEAPPVPWLSRGMRIESFSLRRCCCPRCRA